MTRRRNAFGLHCYNRADDGRRQRLTARGSLQRPARCVLLFPETKAAPTWLAKARRGATRGASKLNSTPRLGWPRPSGPSTSRCCLSLIKLMPFTNAATKVASPDAAWPRAMQATAPCAPMLKLLRRLKDESIPGIATKSARALTMPARRCRDDGQAQHDLAWRQPQDVATLTGTGRPSGWRIAPCETSEDPARHRPSS